MKELDTLTISKVGQGTFPKWWRDVSGLAEGGIVEVRPMRDGKNSIVLTPRPAKRRGGVGLLDQFSLCPTPFTLPERHNLPFK